MIEVRKLSKVNVHGTLRLSLPQSVVDLLELSEGKSVVFKIEDGRVELEGND